MELSKYFQQFFHSSKSSGIVLIICVMVSLIIANTSLSEGFQTLLNSKLGTDIFHLNYSVSVWINDGLMAIFFLLVGLEIKRELVEGELSDIKKASLPIFAAIGGMLVPALIYVAYNHDTAFKNGWAIPMATDIAFALGVLSLLSGRVPLSLKVFLLALAIIDDLGVIIIIALFYTHEVSVQALGIAAAAIALLGYMNWRGVGKTSAYLLVGLVLWVCILKSGVHATLAGVIVGFMIPLHTKDKRSPSESLEHGLHPWVAYLILPIFAFANAGVSLQGVSFSGLTSLLPLGIASALFVGKPLGIFVFSWLAVKLGIAKLPDAINFKQIFAVSVLCGIGFTMSIFIASLAFGDADIALTTYSKLGILLGSTAAAVVGYSLLRLALPTNKKLSD